MRYCKFLSSWPRLFCVTGKPLVRSCSTAPLFSDVYSLSPLILEKMHEQGLVHPTDIQEKSLKILFEEKPAYTVINAETGSGKTLCYLLPILELLSQHKENNQIIPAALGLVLVPTPLLAHQVIDVFRSLAQPEWGYSLSIKGNKLTLKRDTHLIVATPTTLQNFSHTKLVQNLRYLCIDEADMLLTSGEKTTTWNILDAVRKEQKNRILEQKRSSNDSDVVQHHGSPLFHCQVIFAAATLPAGGRMTISSRLRRWLPQKSTQFVTTELAHHIVPSVDLRFTDVEETLDDSGLKGVCESDGLSKQQHHSDQHPRDNLVKVKLRTLLSDLDELKESTLPRVLVFTNSQESANEVFQYLLRRSQEDESLWWRGKVHLAIAQLDSLKETIDKFKSGETQVLVCTDLVSRGVDMPAVTAVIQFDFPGNSADFLHRAGRTARAGNAGLVISYIKSDDRDLAAEIKGVIQNKSKSFDSIFSRNKMFRRKINRRKAAELRATGT